MKINYFLLGLVLCVSSNLWCMKRSIEDRDGVYTGEADNKRQRTLTEDDSFFEFGGMLLHDHARDGDGVMSDGASDSDLKDSSDSAASAAAAIMLSLQDDLSDSVRMQVLEPEFTGLEDDLHVAIQGHDTARVAALLRDGANVLAHDDGSAGDTALHCAVRAGVETAIIQLLVDASVDLEARNDDNVTPLLLAAELVKMDVIEFLLQAGAGRKAIDLQNGETVLHKLMQWECGVDNLRKLIGEYGVSMHVRDFYGTTPVFMALQNNILVEGFYVAKMKYYGQRVYNALYRNYRKKVSKIREITISTLGYGSIDIPSVLINQVMDYVFCERPVALAIEEVVDEKDSVLDSYRTAAE